MGLLPALDGPAAFEVCRHTERLWRPAIEAIADRHRLAGEPHRFTTGSVIVYAVGDRVIKLHEPWNQSLFETEAACLSHLDGLLSVPAPRLHATGTLEGWRYLVMERLPGQPLDQVREQLSLDELSELCTAAGRLATEIQAVPVSGPLAGMMPWPRFMAEQRAGSVAHHRAYGVPPRLLDGLEAQITDVDLDAASPVLLHTELTDTNLLVDRIEDRWRLTGVIDFEPAMVGHPLYDLPAITIFMARGVPRLCRAALAGYGIAAPDSALRRRLLALNLLHRYSRLDYFLELVGVDQYPSDWDRVATSLLGW